MIVFVHGVPETAAIWNSLRDAISRESVALSLPGFGGPRPDRFAATKDDYVEWLVRELDEIEGPIDLVGHDWGALLTYRIATVHRQRVRSWAADVGNLIHPDYRWHDFARIYQTAGEGEALVEAMLTVPPQDVARTFEDMGVPHDDALAMARSGDAVMGACILDLYRSAVPNTYAEWGPCQPTSSAGLILHPTDDPFSNEEQARVMAKTFGARFSRLNQMGHFWAYQAPVEAASVLENFWATLD